MGSIEDANACMNNGAQNIIAPRIPSTLLSVNEIERFNEETSTPGALRHEYGQDGSLSFKNSNFGYASNGAMSSAQFG